MKKCMLFVFVPLLCATLMACDHMPSTAPSSTSPKVTLNAPALLQVGEAGTIDWQVTQATSCAASGDGWSGAKEATTGVEKIGPFTAPGSIHYGLICTGPGGSTQAMTTVTVIVPSTPPGADVVYLVGPNGLTHMWAKLTSITPTLGSTIQVGQRICPVGCFQASMTLGMDPIDNPNVGADFEGGFSVDGATIQGETFINTSAPPSRPNSVTYGPWFFKFVPVYIIVRGTHFHGEVDPAENGSATFLLGYR